MSPPPDQAVRQFTVGYDDDGIRLDRWFKRHLPDTSFTIVAKWARTGQLRLDGARVGPGDRIAAGQPLFTLLADDENRFGRALDALDGAYEIGAEAPASAPLVLERITA